jgi:hypothetical protein
MVAFLINWICTFASESIDVSNSAATPSYKNFQNLRMPNIELTRAQSAKTLTVSPEPGDSSTKSLGVAFNDLLGSASSISKHDRLVVELQLIVYFGFFKCHLAQNK